MHKHPGRTRFERMYRILRGAMARLIARPWSVRAWREFAKIIDIQMLVNLTGKERTHAEWKELLNAGGFELTRIVPTPSFAHVVEAVRIKYRAG